MRDAHSRARYAVAGLSVSVAALASIALSEGYSSVAYRDPVGIPTIGYGETYGVQMGQTTTRERALVQLSASADKHAQGMSKCVTVPLTQNEFDAYADFTYNVGVGAFCRSTLVKKLNAMDYVGACAELLKWVYAGGKILPGLVKRRQRDYEKCLA